MRSQLRPWVLILMAGVLGATSLGCQEEGQDTRNIVYMTSINGNSTLFSDVAIVEETPDPPGPPLITVSVAADMVEVSVQSRAHDPALSVAPNEPFGSVSFRSYEVRYIDPDQPGRPDGADLDNNGTTDLVNFTGAMSMFVQTGEAAAGAIQIISVEQKTKDPVACLGPLGMSCGTVVNNEYTVAVQVTLIGVEETSGDEVRVEGGITVSLANYADE